MSERIQKQREYQERETTEVEVDTKRQDAAKAAGEAVMNDLDELLEEIDEVLEENAEDFVRAYVQKGGE